MKKIGIFIAGRLNSERLPNKLILPLTEDKTLNLWSIACMKLSFLQGMGYNVYALCNDKKLMKIAKKWKVPIIERAPETTKLEGPFSEIFKDLKNVEDDYLMFLNPCLYNLPTTTIKEALEYFDKSPYDSMTSVKEFKNWLYQKAGDQWWLKTIIDKSNWSTKTVKGYYEAAHCFHVFQKDKLFGNDTMLENQHDCFIIENEDETLDVDTPEDFEYAKYIMKESLKD